jgi:phosphate transport system substrate-binding protein
MKATVSQDPYGIGYVSVGHIDNSVSPVAIDGVAPSTENVIAGTYTVARGIFSNTKGEPSGLVKKFIDFLFTDEMQSVIKEKGFIAVSK